MRIAAVAYAPSRNPGWAALDRKLDAVVGGAAADLVVLPEYAGVEAALMAAPPDLPPRDWRDLTADRAEGWLALMQDQARRHRCHLMTGTTLVRTGRGIVNRAYLIAPDGTTGFQDKLILTPYERDVLDLSPGEGLRTFETVLGRIGILVCYDCEFPLLARQLVAAGAGMLLVPSCTDLPAGQTRVRQSARARAIEGQCLVVQAPLVGGVAGCDIVDVNTGRAAVFAPPDHGLPPDGILAQGAPDAAGAVVATVDPAAVAAPRLAGQVGNHRHWPEQERWLHPAESLRIS